MTRSHTRGRARLSVRVSALIAAFVAVAPMLALASVAAVHVQRRDLTNSVFLVAEDQARTAAKGIDGSSASVNPSLGGEQTVVQVVRRSGQVVSSSSAVRGLPALVGPPNTDRATRSTTGVGQEEERFAVVAVAVPGTDEYVVVGRSLESVDEATASTTRILLIGVPAILAVFAGLSWWLTGRALRPVEVLRTRASEITATGDEARLPEGPTSNEIGRLARTLNEMLDRLDANARAQRQFVADASHELRSPIAAIRTVMEVAGPDLPNDWPDVRSDVLDETYRLERLVGQLLYLARHDVQLQGGSPADQSLKPAPLPLLVEPETNRPRRLPVTVEIRASPLVHADQASVSALLGNLLDNAARHAQTTVSVVIDEADGGAVVTVEDDGEGIAATDSERVFARFVRLDSARDRDAGGSGLGLAIARATAERLGGDVKVDPSFRSGARFVVWLPTARDD